MKLVALLLAVSGFLGASSARALDVAVSNYSWLQGPASTVTPFIGTSNNLPGTSFGETADFRWGDYVWLPTNTMTGTGTETYYAGVQLDQSRQINSVKLQWWTNGGNTATQFYIDGSNDGSSWTNIANQLTGFTTVNGAVTNVPVTPGNYEYIRVRLEGPDYQAGGGYGGPGFLLIEPSGNGTVSSDKVNWANAQFGTSATNTNMPTYNSTTYNDGTLEERGNTSSWTGTQNNWNTLNPAAYTTLNLGQARLLSEAVAIWSHTYNGTTFDIEYSTNGNDFFAVNNPSNTQYSPTYFIGTTEQQFDPVIATHIRMRNAAGTNGYTLINQLLLHSPTEGVLASNPGANGTISLLGDANAPTATAVGAVTLENTGGSETAIGIFGYTITGLDAAEFDLVNFAPTILLGGENAGFDLEFTSPTNSMLTALLTFNTSVGSISFNLEASPAPAPEPSTALLLALGCLVPMVRRRRRRS